jgi:hypothetical protein
MKNVRGWKEELDEEKNNRGRAGRNSGKEEAEDGELR